MQNTWLHCLRIPCRAWRYISSIWDCAYADAIDCCAALYEDADD